VKQKISWMHHAPVGAKKEEKRKKAHCCLFLLHPYNIADTKALYWARF
jgi:hypothetical protein